MCVCVCVCVCVSSITGRGRVAGLLLTGVSRCSPTLHLTFLTRCDVSDLVQMKRNTLSRLTTSDVAAEGAVELVVDRRGAETEGHQRRPRSIKTGWSLIKCAKLRSNRGQTSNISNKRHVAASVLGILTGNGSVLVQSFMVLDRCGFLKNGPMQDCACWIV